MAQVSFILFGIFLFSVPAFAAQQDDPNCRLTTRISYTEGGRSLRVTEVYAPNRAACRQEATAMAVNDEPERIRLKKVSFSFRTGRY